MTPIAASKKKNEIKVWRNLHPDEIKDVADDGGLSEEVGLMLNNMDLDAELDIKPDLNETQREEIRC